MTTNGNGTPEPAQSPLESTQSSAGPFGIPTKTLLIAGGGGGGVLVIVIVVAVLLFSGVFGGGNPQPSSILDLVPDDAELVSRMDLQRILANDLLTDEVLDEDDWEWVEDDLGISFEDLSEFVFVVWRGSEVILISGNFDLDYVRDTAEDEGSEANSYRGYEIWEDPDGSSAALLEGYFVISEAARPVENILKALYNKEGSVARADDGNELKRVLDKIPDGFMQFAVVGDNCRVERCEGYGWAITEVDEDDEESTVEIALLFRNERAAESAADDYDEVADFLEQEGLDIEDTEADGAFVIGQATRDFLEEQGAAPAVPVMAASVAATRVPPPVEATATPVSASSGPVVARIDWVDDCADLALSEGNQFLPRHQQMDSRTASQYCECLYDYTEEWDGPPTATMGALVSGRAGADALHLADVLMDASLHCAS